MTNTIDQAILKLKADTGDVVFTGYITNACVENPPSLVGEIWHRAGAGESGRFADGHRIETSAIVQIHTRGTSLWVITESGSTYGILSFTPLGWTYFSHIYVAHSRLDTMSTCIPNFFMTPSRESRVGLGRAFLNKVNNLAAKKEPKTTTHSLRGPEPDLNYIQKMSAHAQETMETLRRNGVKIKYHEE